MLTQLDILDNNKNRAKILVLFLFVFIWCIFEYAIDKSMKNGVFYEIK